MSDDAQTAEKQRLTVDVPLDTPIQRGKLQIDTLTLRKPKGGALSGVKTVDLLNLDLVAASKVVPRISSPRITAQEFLDMEAEDCVAVAGEVAAFLLQKRQKVEAGLEA